MTSAAPLAVVLLIALLSFGFCAGALALHRSQGLAPLMLVIGLLEGVKYHVAAWLWVDLPGGGAVSGGSLVGYINLLAVMLVVHLRIGLAAARVMAWGVVALSLMLGLLHMAYLGLSQQPGVALRVLRQVDHWAIGLHVQSVGNALLLLGLVGSVLLVEWLRQRGLPLLLALVLTLQVVVQLDTPLFLLLAFGPEALDAPTLLANAIGKGGMALVFALLAWTLLRERNGVRLPVLARGRLRELLGAYAFRRRRMEALELELQTDPLTGLFNRRYLERTVPDILNLDARRGDPTSLLLLDIDHFKALNDQHGHLVGDHALRHVAVTLQQAVRHHDSVIRYGGEEFLLLLPGTARDGARAVANQVLERLARQPLELADGHPLTLSATIGVAVSGADGGNWQQLLARADERMYAGKRAGRGRAVA
jgi:diguanylate cyclase (GGDEF)-like protein